MKLRTRVAFMAILFLVGWVLASPHYRPAPDPQDPETPGEAPPLLQLQRSPSSKSPSLQASLPGSPLVDPYDREGLPRREFVTPKEFAAAPKNTAAASQELDQNPTPGNTRRLRQLLPKRLEEQLQPTTTAPRPPRNLHATAVGNRAETRRTLRALKPPTPPGAVLQPVKLVVQRVGEPWPPATRNLQQDRPLPPATALQPTRNISQPGPPRAAAKPPAQRPTVAARQRLERHRVVNGDSLQNIAREYLGDARHALLIFEANRERLVSPNILPLGLELLIPQLPGR